MVKSATGACTDYETGIIRRACRNVLKLELKKFNKTRAMGRDFTRTCKLDIVTPAKKSGCFDVSRAEDALLEVVTSSVNDYFNFIRPDPDLPPKYCFIH